MATKKYAGGPMSTDIYMWVEYHHCETCKCGSWKEITLETLEKRKPKLYLKDGVRYDNRG